MAKRKVRPGMGTGLVLGGGALGIGAWSPLIAALVLGVILVLALTVAVVVLTAARSRDQRQQRNSAAVLDRLLRASERAAQG